MRNRAVDTLFKLREVPDKHLAEFLSREAPSRTLHGVTWWRFADGSFVWTRGGTVFERNVFRVAPPNRRPPAYLIYLGYDLLTRVVYS